MPAGRLWRVGPQQPIERIGEAIARAQDGDVIRIAPGHYRADVAVILQRRLTLQGEPDAEGRLPVLEAAGAAAEGKAIWVVRGGAVAVSQLEFRGARVPDRNGAGIRFEQGQLKVLGCRFIDNENGLLTGNHPEADLRVEDCLFADAPMVDDGLHHLLYAGRIARLSVLGCRFQRGWHAHLVKSRARQSTLVCNALIDGPEGRAAYAVDLPNGGEAFLIGNLIGQSEQATNPALLAFGAEGQAWAQSRLRLVHNTLQVQRVGGLYLLARRDRLPPEARVDRVNNLLLGWGVGLGLARWPALLPGPVPEGEDAGNWHAAPSMLADAALGDWRLPPGSWLRGRVEDPAQRLGAEARPDQVFTLPLGRQPLAPPFRWSPGAYPA